MPNQSSPLALFPTRLAVAFNVEAAFFSAIAVTGLLLYLLFNAISRRWRLETHIHYFFLNLLVSDLLHAIGGMMTIKWVIDAKVTEGPFCTAQGVIKHMGALSAAFSTLTIALYTVSVLVFQYRTRPETALWVIGVTWLFIILEVTINAKIHPGYFGSAIYWCWITKPYFNQKIGFEYLFLWLTAFGSLVVYAFLALVISRVLIVENNRVRLSKAHERHNTRLISSQGDQKDATTLAMSMLFYPAVYLITVVPFITVRTIFFKHPNIPFAATGVTGFFFSSLGLFDVIVFTWTRPSLFPTRTPVASALGSLSSDWRRPSSSRIRAESRFYPDDYPRSPNSHQVFDISSEPRNVPHIQGVLTFPTDSSFIDPFDDSKK